MLLPLKARAKITATACVALQLWICLVLVVFVVHGQTSIVAALGPHEVVIGADSKRKISEFDPSGSLVGVTSTLACKIQKADGFYFGCSGPCGEVDVASIIVQASRRTGTIQRKVELAAPLVEDALNDMLTNKSRNALRRYANKPTILQLLFVGIQAGTPLILGVDFHYRRSPSGVLSVRAGEIQSCEATTDACTHLAIGKTNAISNFSRKKGTMDFLARVQPIVGVERLIQMEIDEEGDDVGPPIDLLRITRSGAQWIRRKPQCLCDAQVIGWDRGRPARKRAESAQSFGRNLIFRFRASRSLRPGRPRSPASLVPF